MASPENVDRVTNERAYTPSLVLHVLRNPHGWSVEAITAARLQAADEIERLRDALKRVRRVAAEGTTHTGMISALGILVDRALNPGNGPLPPDYTYHSHEPSEVRPLSEWHEDDGPAVWWKFPVEEAAWIGGPNDSDWPGYHTHWTPHPPVPEQRLRTPQGEPALTHVDGLPGTREPVSQQPHGTAGESPALFNCGYDPTSHGWVIREGSREGVLVACFLREEDANSYVIPAYALKSETVKDSCGPGCAMGANRPAQKSDEIRDLACCDVFTRESASEFCATCGYTNLDHLRRRANNGSKQS